MNCYSGIADLKIALGITSTTDDVVKLGDTRRGKELGLSPTRPWTWYIRVECPRCHQQRWILKCRYHELCYCRKCWGFSTKGIKHKNWKGGSFVTEHGYVQIRVYPNDFFSPMADHKGYVLGHRLVMAKQLGRCLHRWEIVHHKNHIKDDNRLENLQLVSDDRHKQITILERRIKFLEQRVTQLEAEAVLSRGQENECVL